MAEQTTANASVENEPSVQTDELGGNYEVIRKRLLARADQLNQKAEQLNTRRKEVVGGSEMTLISTERVRTENNCLPRDCVSISGKLLVGYDVFMGLKAEVVVPDIFSVHKLERKDTGIELGPQPWDSPGSFLTDENFI